MIKHPASTFLLLTLFTHTALVARIPDDLPVGLPSVTTDPALISAEEMHREQAIPLQLIRNNELINAVIAGNIQAVENTIDQGADVNCVADNGWTPLTIACKHDTTEHTQIVLILLEYDANPNQPTSTNLTPLGLACELDLAAYQNALALLNKQAKPNTKYGPKNRLPLLTAVFKKNRLLVEILLEHGAEAKPVWKNRQQHWDQAIKKLLKAAYQRQQAPSPAGITNFLSYN